MSSGHRPFVVGPAATELLDSPEAHREEFARTRSLPCHDIFDPGFFKVITGFIDRAAFTQEGVQGLLFRTTETPARAGGAISLALRRPNLLRWVEAVTGCDTLVRVSGRVQQVEASPDTELEWHNDMWEPTRRIGITINLGDQPYEGGEFELRDYKGNMLTEHRHVDQGSALLFDVGRRYEHRVLPVTAGGPRRVYAGWFYKGEP
ncbi:MAG: 2OG-Fe(II) oxygenase [Pseudomonadota bacterium]